MRSLICCTLLAALLLSACQDGLDHLPAGGHSWVKVELSGYGADAVSAADAVGFTALTGYHFADGSLCRIYEDFRKADGGYALEVDRPDGTLYVVAWSGEAPPYGPPPLGTAEADWLRTAVTGAAMFATGSMPLSDAAASGVQTVRLRRGLARFDLEVDVAGQVQVRRAVVRNAWTSGWLFSQDGLPAAPGDVGPDVELAPTAYLHEQANARLEALVEAEIDGREYTLTAPLPAVVRRNTRYTVTLRQTDPQQAVTLTVTPWGDGGTADAVPDRNRPLTVDTGRTPLPTRAVLLADGRTLVLPHGETDFLLRIDADEELELVSASAYLLEVTPQPVTGPTDMNTFRVRKRLYAPGVAGTDAVVRFRRKSLAAVHPDDAVVLRLRANPTTVEGPMSFDNPDYAHDFGRYVDNGLGTFTLPAGSRLQVAYAPGEDAWVRLDSVAARTWRVVAGWRPNDPTANGRRQEARLVVRHGDATETYTVVRRNYGLPVTLLQGIWWCKYNAMGHSRDFEDQVLASDDPAAAAGQTLFEYLTTCAPEDYRRLWEWAYQGDSGQGLRVVAQDGRLVMEGYDHDERQHINRLPADALSPPGYELPSMDDFNRLFDATETVWLMWNGTHTLRNPWEGYSRVRRQHRRKQGVVVDTVAAADLVFIAMEVEGQTAHEPIVWYGPGAQWNAEGIQHAGHFSNILFGVHSPAGEGWYMAGGLNAFYLHKNGAGSRDTRVLRFKKSPVDYVY